MSISDAERRVIDRLDPDAIAELTAELVRVGGENPGGTEEATATRLAFALRALGAEVEMQIVEPGRPNLIARMGDHSLGDGILFLGHSDVVPAGEGWTRDSYACLREGDALYGRGTTDMKGGLAAVVSAMAAVNAELPHLPMTLVVTVDEELGAKGVLHYIEHEPVGSYRACIVAEPTNLVTITACRGAMNIRVDVEGASAHAGKPDEGANAIVAATEVIAAVEDDDAQLRQHPHPVLGSGNWSVGTIEGGHGTSIVADRCTLTIDRRILPEEQPDAILNNLLADARGRIRDRDRVGTDRIRVSGEVEMVMPGFETEPETELVNAVVHAVRDAGGAGEVGVWTAACEGGFLHRHHGVDCLVFGPGDLTTQAHQPDEHVLVSDLHLAARAYALMAVRAALAGQSAAQNSR